MWVQRLTLSRGIVIDYLLEASDSVLLNVDSGTRSNRGGFLSSLDLFHHIFPRRRHILRQLGEGSAEQEYSETTADHYRVIYFEALVLVIFSIYWSEFMTRFYGTEFESNMLRAQLITLTFNAPNICSSLLAIEFVFNSDHYRSEVVFQKLLWHPAEYSKYVDICVLRASTTDKVLYHSILFLFNSHENKKRSHNDCPCWY